MVAPGFLPFPVSTPITPEQMRDYVQCVIRDTARHSPPRDYYLIEGARSWTVSDQLMKKELILQGMGWGHMPALLVDEELRDGRLLSIAGRHLQAGRSSSSRRGGATSRTGRSPSGCGNSSARKRRLWRRR